MNEGEYEDLEGFDEIKDFDEMSDDTEDLLAGFEDDLMNEIGEMSGPGIGHFKTLFGIAMRNFSLVKEFCEEREILQKKSSEEDDNLEAIFEISAQIQRASVTTVVFSYLTLDSYINYYGIIRIPDGVDSGNADLHKRWTKLPELACGKKIEKSGALDVCNELTRLQNKMTYGSQNEPEDSLSADWIGEEDAFNAIEGVRVLFKELRKIDDKVEIDWLDKVEHDPFV